MDGKGLKKLREQLLGLRVRANSLYGGVQMLHTAGSGCSGGK